MRRRRLLLSLAAVALLGVAGIVLYFWLAIPIPSVSRANFRRLRFEMSPRQVEALLGKPHETFVLESSTQRVWHGKKMDIYLSFVGDRLAGGWTQGENLPTDTSLVDHIRQLLPW